MAVLVGYSQSNRGLFGFILLTSPAITSRRATCGRRHSVTVTMRVWPARGHSPLVLRPIVLERCVCGDPGVAQSRRDLPFVRLWDDERDDVRLDRHDYRHHDREPDGPFEDQAQEVALPALKARGAGADREVLR